MFKRCNQQDMVWGAFPNTRPMSGSLIVIQGVMTSKEYTKRVEAKQTQVEVEGLSIRTE